MKLSKPLYSNKNIIKNRKTKKIQKNLTSYQKFKEMTFKYINKISLFKPQQFHNIQIIFNNPTIKN